MKPIFVEKPSTRETDFIGTKVLEFNQSKIENYKYENFQYQITDNSNYIIAGIDCQVGGGWLYIKNLWVEESDRGKGLGNSLLSAAELKAVQMGCHSSYLYTYSFQSPEFYKNNGYSVLGKLENFFGDDEKFFLKKRLA